MRIVTGFSLSPLESPLVILYTPPSFPREAPTAATLSCQDTNFHRPEMIQCVFFSSLGLPLNDPSTKKLI